MPNVPLLVLFTTPKNLPGPWKAVFESIKVPLQLASSLLRNPDLVKLSEQDLAAYWSPLQASMSRLSESLDELDVVAHKTWEAGFAIRKTVWPVWAILTGLTELELASTEAQRENRIATIRRRLVEKSKTFTARPLLERLRETVAAEMGIDLGERKSDRPKQGKPARKATINARMLEAIQKDTNAMGWNSTKWAEELKCSKPAIVGTETWENCKMARERKRAERARDRRQRKRHLGNSD